jgi:hypothetical protein
MGVMVAVTALALQGRGLGVGEIGSLFAIYAAVTLTAELPFGGLADGVGRKPVFLIATVASMMASIVFLLSEAFWPLAAAFGLVGLGRALRSGTLCTVLLKRSWKAELTYPQYGSPGHQHPTSWTCPSMNCHTPTKLSDRAKRQKTGFSALTVIRRPNVKVRIG